MSTIGVLKEVKKNEFRVALTPTGCAELVKAGHAVHVEQGAGLASGFDDTSYLAAGGVISSVEQVWQANIVLHVKEPQPEEYKFFTNQTLFTYLHLASNPKLKAALAHSKVTAFAYENVEPTPGMFPLLMPMSEVAGRMAVLEGAKYLEKHYGGKGKLICGVPGVEPAHVIILGAGVVGANATRIATALGARVTVLDQDIQKLRTISAQFPTCSTALCSDAKIAELLPQADLIIGAILQPNASTPKLITRAMLKQLTPGTVLVDVAIDQGGCFESSKPTSHADPVFIEEGIVHYCVANMPGAVAQTSTLALTNATLKYVLNLAQTQSPVSSENLLPGLLKARV